MFSLVSQLAQTHPDGTVVTGHSDVCLRQKPGPGGYCIRKAEGINDDEEWKKHDVLSS